MASIANNYNLGSYGPDAHRPDDALSQLRADADNAPQRCYEVGKGKNWLTGFLGPPQRDTWA